MSSITERTNELSSELDRVDSRGICKLFRQCDAQIFTGYSDYESINDSSIQNEIIEFVECVVDRLRKQTVGKVNIVATGAGTSGRLAFFIARSFNRILGDDSERITFSYLIAGGDLCLTVGIEGAEDNISQAIVDLESQINPDDTLVYIGITCGFSAPYVAAQLDYLLNLNSDKHIISLMGFNPVALARPLVIEKWTRSFKDITNQLESNRVTEQQKSKLLRRHFILNPVFGPEPLTGSTRMKSGTGTKILLESMFSLILSQYSATKYPLTIKNTSHGDSVHEQLISILKAYEETFRDTYLNIDSIAPMIDSVGNSLRAPNHSGHLYYLAAQSLGIVGFIDASETVPTYGADSQDVNGFLLDDKSKQASGWNVMANRDGDLSNVSVEYKISQKDFIDKIPSMSAKDTIVISVASLEEYNQLSTDILPLLVSNSGNNVPTIYLIQFINAKNQYSIPSHSAIKNIVIKLNHCDIIANVNSFYEISLKLIHNALTTGGFVLAGKVYGNRMIDLGLTNNKLYYRSCGIINSIMKLNNEEKARHYLLRSIYSIDSDKEIPSELDSLPVYKHIEYAEQNKIKNVVPVGLLLASGKFQSPSNIREEIQKQPIIRYLLDQNKPTI
ncbi:hypothetical protein CYY_005498 [Polysphondylium violaceum]|uniref:SIS domain-containing protein n=1 Tax=Polysphondylium violaceum TaxID=133409 RepID=A0A8J4Q2Z1_9MYCE|nr:hypothetical protein CYY_005498 [Polysphondylium violaceum]